MREEPAALAALLSEHRGTGSGGGFPPWLRQRVGRWVVAQRAAGAELTQLAHQVGVSRPSLANWARAFSTAEPTAPELTAPVPPGFSEVVLVDAPTPVAAERERDQDRDPLHIVSPSGFTLRGLSLAEAVQALSVLR